MGGGGEGLPLLNPIELEDSDEDDDQVEETS